MKRNIVIIGMCILLTAYVVYSGHGESIDFGIDESNDDLMKEEAVECSLEVLVLDELDIDNEKVQLIYRDKAVELYMYNQSLIIDSGISEEELFGNNDMPNVEFKLHKISGTSYAGISESFPTMNNIEVKSMVVSRQDDCIDILWESSEVISKIVNIDSDNVVFECYKNTEPIVLRLNENEIRTVTERMEELKADNIETDEAYWNSLEENLICEVTGCQWENVDEEDCAEMILSVYYRTVGAMTPLSLREKGILIFNIDESVELSDVIFERSNEDERFMKYFIGER